ncbi:unannotated protein [freshwater metagenome]|uniref:Unannotated protein n=1 Tax=freshwater metagenome TaxID=449393 RepID=A0A6J7KS07_9ZZZZ|nr:LrgB family protein [Actinomycetota bacterium]MSW37585.1 LrgB family protein [Actinomycetota bacterium]
MTLLTVYCIAITIGAYAVSRAIGRRYPSPLTVPVFLSTPLVMLVLWGTHIDLSGYSQAKSIMTYLLGPATVALAVPLYRHRHVLIKDALPFCVGLVSGTFSTMIAAIGCAKLLGLSPELQAALSIKSVTAPIAIALAPKIDADPTLTAGFVIITGLVGSMFGPWLLTRMRITRAEARGEALGTISHGQGTAEALHEGDLTGAASSIAMGSAAVLTSLIAIPLVRLVV